MSIIKKLSGNIKVSKRQYMICGDINSICCYPINYTKSCDIYIKTLTPGFVARRSISIDENFYLVIEQRAIFEEFIEFGFGFDTKLLLNHINFPDRLVNCLFVHSIGEISLPKLKKKLKDAPSNVAEAYINVYDFLCKDNCYRKAIAPMTKYQKQFYIRRFGI